VKFGLTHRILTSTLAALGVLAIVLSGALPKISVVLLLLGLVGALLATERFQQSTAARYTAAIVPSVLLGVELLRFVGGAPLLDLAVEFAAALQIVRLATRRGAMHDQQVILLALLHLVAGTVLDKGIAYGFCLFGFLLLAPGALVLSHLRREVEGNYRQGARDRTGLPVDVPRILRSRRVIGPGFLALTCLLSLPIVVFTAALFILFPRVGLSLLIFQNQHALRSTGFSDTVDLSGVGAIRSDPAVVIRFKPPNLPDPAPPRMVLRLRGTAFDEYRGGGQWSRTSSERVQLGRMGADIPLTRVGDPAKDALFQFELEPLDPTVLFLPPRAVALRWSTTLEGTPFRPPALTRGAEQTLRYEGSPDRVLRYDVYVAPPTEALDEPLPDRERARYLQLPRELSARTRKLAEEWTSGLATDAQKANAIQRHLSTEYRYTLAAPSGGKPDPIDDFLFESHAGHCEFFSTAMSLLLREANVPSRNVSGFVGGTYNRFGGFYTVRQGDAHSWVEAYIESGGHGGWVTFDPTPTSGAQPLVGAGGFFGTMREMFEAISQGWDRYVVGYDLPTQLTLVQRIQRSLESSRKAKAADGGRSTPLGRPVLIALGTVALAGGAYWLWRRRRHEVAPSPTTVRAKQQRVATELWMQLEDALTARGAARPRNVPPLRFTEQLKAEGRWPFAEEAWTLASRYAQARFGGAPLSPEEEREFARRVAAIRKPDPRTTVTTSAAE
jgi:transglutaminase-like putative cysteine protease